MACQAMVEKAMAAIAGTLSETSQAIIATKFAPALAAFTTAHALMQVWLIQVVQLAKRCTHPHTVPGKVAGMGQATTRLL